MEHPVKSVCLVRAGVCDGFIAATGPCKPEEEASTEAFIVAIMNTMSVCKYCKVITKEWS